MYSAVTVSPALAAAQAARRRAHREELRRREQARARERARLAALRAAEQARRERLDRERMAKARERARQRTERVGERRAVERDGRIAAHTELRRAAVGRSLQEVAGLITEVRGRTDPDTMFDLDARLSELRTRLRLSPDAALGAAVEELRGRVITLRHAAAPGVTAEDRPSQLAELEQRLTTIGPADPAGRVRCEEQLGRLRTALAEGQDLRFDALLGSAEHELARHAGAVAREEDRQARALAAEAAAAERAEAAAAAARAGAAPAGGRSVAGRSTGGSGTGPADPADPIDPIDPVDPVDPTGPSGPAAAEEAGDAESTEGTEDVELAAELARLRAEAEAARLAAGLAEARERFELVAPWARDAAQDAADFAEAGLRGQLTGALERVEGALAAGQAASALAAVQALELLLPAAEERLDTVLAAYERRAELARSLKEAMAAEGLGFLSGETEGQDFVLVFGRANGATYQATLREDPNGVPVLSYVVEGESDRRFLPERNEVVCESTEALLDHVHGLMAPDGYQPAELDWDGKPPPGQAGSTRRQPGRTA
ncbi:hypothetical protein CFP65_1404 [Kitasatospora sp. MMS16-BH015]|nr:hypothetical protein CFP65_1404 [Kitasatospora sp. MMS16-BH015]